MFIKDSAVESGAHGTLQSFVVKGGFGASLHGHVHLPVFIVALAFVKVRLCVVCIKLEEEQRARGYYFTVIRCVNVGVASWL